MEERVRRMGAGRGKWGRGCERLGTRLFIYRYSRARGMEKVGMACNGGFALWQLPGMRGEGVGNGGCNEGMWVRSEV